LILTI